MPKIQEIPFPSFNCQLHTLVFTNFPDPDKRHYIPCTADLCPLMDESDFAVQIFMDIATVRDLTPEGTPVNLDKFHYTVAASEISANIDFTDNGLSNLCSVIGFKHGLLYQKLTEDLFVQYDIRVDPEIDI